MIMSDVVSYKKIVDVEKATDIDDIFVNKDGKLRQITKEQFIKSLKLITANNKDYENVTNIFEKEEVTIIPNSTYEFEYNEGFDGMTVCIYENTGDLPQEDNEYSVIWNNTEYKCKAMFDSGDGTYILGNMGVMMDGESTGEPFVIALDSGICLIVPLDGSTSATVHCYGENIKPIDIRFIPKTYTLDLTAISEAIVINEDAVTTYGFEDFDNLRKAIDFGNVRVKARILVKSLTDVFINTTSTRLETTIVFHANIEKANGDNIENYIQWRLSHIYNDRIIYIEIDETTRKIKAIIKKLSFA